ncbi:PAS domain S-box protein [Mucilaginibacter psychrotolerans]|uniref:histidine kinase n=1 Tax=Mucilaginibacter psychrotolerans TaxID=1524096 RepID=A0A4Y8SFP7_9SPHI|nr:PAS domain S-box protein [Mucilaginibacter psychrotolerans]TFF37470.1 PAS domain S-box protein [Mucilaginibacter psychrotolerans]
MSEDEFDQITELASIICDTPISLVSLIDTDRQWFKSNKGLGATQTHRDLAFCAHTIMGTEVMEVQDATMDTRFKDNALVTGEPEIRFYAGFPLTDPDGFTLGSLCVIDRKTKKLTAQQKRALALLGKQVTDLIIERRKKQKRTNFEKLFGLSQDLIFIGGTDGYFKEINPAFTTLFGWDQNHLLKTSTFEFIHPDDIESTTGQLNKLLQGKPTINFHQRFKALDGTYKIIEWTSNREESSGCIFGIGRDVTENILQKQHLADSEAKLRAFFENSKGLMCTHHINGKLISVNTSGASLLGYSVAELNGLSLFDIIPAERHKMLRAYLKKIKQEGRAEGQMITLHKDGSQRVWMFNNTLQNNGNESYVIGNAIDITERYALETKLQRTTEMLEQTNQVARVGGWEVDLLSNKVYWTSVTKEIHGVPADYEPNLETGISFYKTGESREKISSVIEKALTDGSPWNEELQLVDLVGNEVWVRALGNAEFENGTCKRLYGTFQDINENKKAEIALQRSFATQEALNEALLEQLELIKRQDQTIEKIKEFQFLADSIPQIIWTSKADGGVDYYNQFWFKYTGLSLEQSIESGWDPVLHPDDVQTDDALWAKSLRTGEPYRSEVRFKRAADGLYKWHLCSGLPMLNDAGEIVKWFGSCYDIDEYKRAIDLENRISLYEDFNRIVAHNLRGPAGSIRMILNMLNETADESEKAEFLQMLGESSDTLNETLTDLMQVLEIRINKEMQRDDCDLLKIVSVTKAMLQGQMLAKQATITTDFKIATIPFPKMYLESIFYNMVSNAIKYSKADVPSHIHIQSAIIDGRSTLTFADNGLGIDLKRHAGQMFKMSSVFHKGYDSKGVGLFMTKTQIETFGGKITVESEPNVGTKFTIVF